MTLAELGWDDGFSAAFDALEDPGLIPARVGIEHNHFYRVLTADGELMAQAAGRLRHRAAGQDELPAVGDWVAVAVGAHDDKATIRSILPRRSSFSRKAAGDPTARQVVAANIDVVLVVAGLDGDFNARRIERYLVATADSGARAAVVLNKADLEEDVALRIAEVREAAPDVPIHPTCCATGQGLGDLARYLEPGRTLALLGSSGVGKSTIINRLLGESRQKTQAVRSADSRGRHTTIHRELIAAPGGGIIIDTPGMRELQLWDSDRALEEAFSEIDALAADCRFRDCRHRQEPGCAVRAAVNAGRLPGIRLTHYLRLEDERAHLDRRRDELARLEEKKRTKVMHRGPRKLYTSS
ncbi:MAG: ribosome small subunit-dependent GTPase A [Acidobacteria bacterium]|nr:ribosome small subunit-dependent GTPase A [Acidobacteriota bacterium]